MGAKRRKEGVCAGFSVDCLLCFNLNVHCFQTFSAAFICCSKKSRLFLGIEGPRMRGSERPSVPVFSGVLGQPQGPAEGALVRSLAQGLACRGSCGMRLRGRGEGGGGAGRRNTCDRGVTASQRPGSAAQRPDSGGMRTPATWRISRHDLFLGFHLSDLGGNLIREEWSVGGG